MNWRKVTIRILAALFLVMLCGAIASHLLWHQAPLQGFGSSSFLYLAGGLVLLAAGKQERLQLFLAGLTGFIAEVVGVQYGWLFGHYRYTEVLAPNWLGTPIVMIFAWLILIGYVRQILMRFRLPTGAGIVLGGLWMTAIDLLIDPVAAHPFNFWNWLHAGAYYGIPLRNFFGWFCVSMVIFSADKLMFRTQALENYLAHIVGLGIIVLYTLCAFTYGYFVAGVVGLGLGLIDLILAGGITGTVSLKSVKERLAN